MTSATPSIRPTDGVRLTAPDAALHPGFLAAYDELGPVHLDGAGAEPMDSAAMHHPQRFADWVADKIAEADPPAPRPADRVPCSYFWITRNEEVLGFLAIRHSLNDFLLREGGHIGYSVRPSARRCGIAGHALASALPITASLGITSALLTCDETNAASRRTIERNGGRYDGSINGKWRYWIDLSG